MFTMTCSTSSSAPGTRPLIAHIDPADPSRTESLATHASNVRSAASRFGARFGCAATAAFAGGIHDFGKAAPEVQDYLWSFTGDCSEEDDAAPLPPGSHRGPDHSTVGAQYAERFLPGLGLLLAYTISVLPVKWSLCFYTMTYHLHIRSQHGRPILVQNNICELKHCLKTYSL